MTESNPYSGFDAGRSVNEPTSLTLPSPEDFKQAVMQRRVTPVVRRLKTAISFPDGSPVAAYVQLAHNRPGTFLLESAEHGRKWSRYSFIGVNCQAMLTEQDGHAQWVGEVPAGIDTSNQELDTLGQVLDEFHSTRIEQLPPLTSGLVGYLSYDIVRRWERLPIDTADDKQRPEFALLLVSDLAVLDHEEGVIYLVANVFVDNSWTESELAEQYGEAVRRLDNMEEDLARRVDVPETHAPITPELGTQLEIRSTATPEEYKAGVEAVREYIRAGDAFQVVLSQRFECDTQADPLEIYRALRELNPSPYMYLFRIPEPDQFGSANRSSEAFAVVGSSPEALVKLAAGGVMLHPIAGTRPRSQDKAEDDALAEDLMADTKERAEHLMLVDLGRNDLGRVSRPGTVEVTEFMNIERYSHVMHIVSTIESQLSPELNAYDLLRATHPAGTLSGAPKVRAMEIIEELESTRRGLYAGCVGYFDFAGDMDAAIAIRTAVVSDGKAYVQAGAGLVADSDPQTEYEECQNKAAAVFRALALAAELEPTRLTSSSGPLPGRDGQ